MSSASCGRSRLNSRTKSSNFACCCRLFIAGGRVASCLSVRCMRSCRPFCWGRPGFMRSIATPGLALQQPGDKAKAFFHHRTRFPRHPHLPPAKSEKCNPCVRYEMSPMSRAAHCGKDGYSERWAEILVGTVSAQSRHSHGPRGDSVLIPRYSP